MPKYLIEEHPVIGVYLDSGYTGEGVKGLQSAGGSSRREAVSEALASVGGSLESFHFGFGDADAYVIAELPDNESAAAVG